MTTSTSATASRMEKPCPFCTLPAGRVVEENELALLILDGYPVTTGHSLIIPKRHVGSFFEATALERAALAIYRIERGRAHTAATKLSVSAVARERAGRSPHGARYYRKGGSVLCAGVVARYIPPALFAEQFSRQQLAA